MLRPAAAADERTQVLNLIDYLAAYDAQRTPSVRDVSEHRLYRLSSTELPDHAAVHLRPAEGCWLSVAFVELPTRPSPPDEVTDMMRPQDFDARDEPEIVEAPTAPGNEDEDAIARWVDDYARWEERAQVARAWIDEVWHPWADGYRQVFQAKRLHRELFEQRERLVADRESFELVWGFGRLKWSPPEGRVDHPLVTVAVEIEVMSGTEEIRIRPSGAADVESRFLNGMDLFDRSGYTAIRQSVAADGLDPWSLTDMDDICTRLVRAIDDEGVVLDGEARKAGPHPAVDFGWTLFVRRRVPDSQAFLDDMRAIYMDDGAIPEPLQMIMTSGEFEAVDPFEDSGDRNGSTAPADPLLLPLPTNEEQQRILRSAQRRAGVTVQGPPGTGKSHTIANLISHYVAYGQRVLVVAEKEQALKVLADKVPAGIRDLTVSVLGADDEGRKRLESSIMSIQTRVAAVDRGYADTRIKQLTSDLDRIDRITAETTTTMLRARKAETVSLPGSWLAGADVTPQQAAAWTAAHRDGLGYVPDLIAPTVPLPITVVELREFLRLLGTTGMSRADEAILRLPDAATLPGLQDLDTLLRRRDQLAKLVAAARVGARDWRRTESASHDHLDELRDALLGESAWLGRANRSWQGTVLKHLGDPIMAGQWHQLREQLESARGEAIVIRMRLDRHRVEIPAQPRADLRSALQDAHKRIGAKGKLGMFASDAKRAIEECRVDGHVPATADEVQLCLDALALGGLRVSMATLWQNQACRAGAPPLEGLIEESVAYAVADLDDVLAMADRWRALNERLHAVGARTMFGAPDEEMLNTSANWCTDASALAEHGVVSRELADLERQLHEGARRPSASPIWAQLAEALRVGDLAGWERLRVHARELNCIRGDALRLTSLRDRLAKDAPVWAKGIVEDPAVAQDPDDLAAAWQWRQLDGWIRDVATMPEPADLQARLDDLAQDRRRTVTDLVVERAWRRLADNLGRPQREALQSYIQAVKKYGKTGGKYAQRWIELMRKALDDSKDAVPVWIMSTSRALTSFRPSRVPPFDVVIIDEASQIGFEALPLLALAKSAIVVGDDKQTSPENVGLDRQRVFDLMDDYLQPIPNFRVLFDPDNSLYDLAIQKFAEPIMLTEHFRCLPEIIDFSNVQAYDNRIIPLRDRPPAPGWVPLGLVRVLDGYRNGDVNEPEAVQVVELIARLCNQPEYDGMTFGVISLLGTAQSHRIWELLYDRIGPEEVERRRIRCGEAANFQGDERDVMVLSTVVTLDSAKRIGPMTGVKHLRRINVAASRAQNQMWVVTSVDADALPAGDLRAALIRHCQNPESAKGTYEDVVSKCESDFERRVLNDLVARGYRAITAQYPVGNYRIDLVVEGPESRLAVECDGDRWHGEDVWYKDRGRQEVLERAGWTFARIRGSSYYRDPENAMEPVWERLDALGIPTGDGWMTQGVRSTVLEVSGVAFVEPVPVDNCQPPPNPDAAAQTGVGATPSIGVNMQDASTASGAEPPQRVGAAAAPGQQHVVLPDLSPPDGRLSFGFRPAARDAAARPVGMQSPHTDEAAIVDPTVIVTPAFVERDPRTQSAAGPSRSGASVVREFFNGGGRERRPERPSTPSTKPPADAGSRVALRRYQEWEMRPVAPIDQASGSDVLATLVEIVTAEGPMHAEWAYRRYVKASGKERLGQNVKSTFNRIMYEAVRRGRLHQIKDDVVGQANRTVFAPGSEPVVIRELGPRKLDDVPRSEIRLVAETLGLGSRPREQVKRAVLEIYGRTSLTRVADRYLEEAFEYRSTW